MGTGCPIFSFRSGARDGVFSSPPNFPDQSMHTAMHISVSRNELLDLAEKQLLGFTLGFFSKISEFSMATEILGILVHFLAKII